LRSRAESALFIGQSFAKPAVTPDALLGPARALVTVGQALTNRPVRVARIARPV
jgi:hypothetical protein